MEEQKYNILVKMVKIDVQEFADKVVEYLHLIEYFKFQYNNTKVLYKLFDNWDNAFHKVRVKYKIRKCYI